MSDMGYKYWVAFEIHCTETEKRMSQSHSIFLDKPVDKESDIIAIESAFKEDLEHRSYENDFRVNLTCWPHYLGRMEKPQETKKPIKRQTPKLSLAVHNTDLKGIIH